ncbi:PASTA domain-containing protein [Pedobacter frigiditerrae]|uniref:PASTA domain-containing protein n=1 Tax=Pedobacter frigiditerrae TaxID=2530452 RepID=A0A4R0MUZ6_9SPHI|nr:PASTA domain-containing protein [Pedobacter frigiditerrae]TCC90587.1 PASTA domain-containing protein [Pedobacter frigiditerrae]
MSNFIAYLKTKSFRNNLIAATCTVVGILLIAFFSLRYYTKHGEGLNVPEVKGLPLAQAVSKLEELGLRYEIDSVYVMDKPPGIVTDQDPDANTFVKGNRTIYLTINTAQAPNVKFPDIENKSLREAQAILESYRLKLGDTTYKPDVAKDVVLEAYFGGQLIRSGEALPTGSRINLTLGDGRGPEDVELPNLTGLTIDEVKMSLRGSVLTLGTVTWEGPVTDSASAVVVTQFPLVADTLVKVKLGTPVNITLSNKPKN